jgi:hypothetical protein
MDVGAISWALGLPLAAEGWEGSAMQNFDLTWAQRDQIPYLGQLLLSKRNRICGGRIVRNCRRSLAVILRGLLLVA